MYGSIPGHSSVPFIYLSIQELKPYYFNYGSMIMSTEIKTHNIKAVSFSFICGLTEDYNLGDSIAVRNYLIPACAYMLNKHGDNIQP